MKATKPTKNSKLVECVHSEDGNFDNAEEHSASLNTESQVNNAYILTNP